MHIYARAWPACPIPLITVPDALADQGGVGPLERQAVPPGPGVALVQVQEHPDGDHRYVQLPQLRGFGRLGVQLKAPAHRRLCTG